MAATLRDAFRRLLAFVARLATQHARASGDDAAPAVERERRRRWAWAGAASVVLAVLLSLGHVMGGVAAVIHLVELFLPRQAGEKPDAPIPAPPKLSIVVLPFTTDGQGGDVWFNDAITSDLTTELSRQTGTLVIGRDSAMRYRERDSDPRVVASELGVRWVLRGTVRRQGDRVRIMSTLIEGETGAVRASDRFDVERSRLGGTVDEISQRVARVIGSAMVVSAAHAAGSSRTGSGPADDLAMQATAVLMRSLDPGQLRDALKLAEQAISEDPSSVRAWGIVSNASALMVGYRWVQGAELERARRRIVEAAETLNRLDPQGFFSLLGQIHVRWSTGDWAGGYLPAADRLVELYPSMPQGHNHRGVALQTLGRFDESIAAFDRALRISPHEVGAARWQLAKAQNLFALGRYAESADSARRAMLAAPALGRASVPLLAAALVRQGRREEAKQVLGDHLQGKPMSYAIAPFRALMRAGASPAWLAAAQRMIDSVEEAGSP